MALVSSTLADLPAINVVTVTPITANEKNDCGQALGNSAFASSGFPFPRNEANCDYCGLAQVGTFSGGPPGLPSGSIITTGKAQSAQLGFTPQNHNWEGETLLQENAQSRCVGDPSSREWSGLRITGITPNQGINTMRVTYVFATNEA